MDGEPRGSNNRIPSQRTNQSISATPSNDDTTALSKCPGSLLKALQLEDMLEPLP
jgi:hypothetical protein